MELIHINNHHQQAVAVIATSMRQSAEWGRDVRIPIVHASY